MADTTVAAFIDSFMTSADTPTAFSVLSAGLVPITGATVRTPAAMAALEVDVTKGNNTKTIAADSALTFSGTPANSEQWFSLRLTNSDTNPHTISIPSSYSMGRQGTITSFVIPASGKVFLTWDYDGAVYNLYGEPNLTSGTGSYALTATPTFTGTPAAPTASAGTSTTQLATTAFVAASALQTEVTLTDGTTITQTMVTNQADQNAKVTLGGNRTLAFSGLAAGMRGNLRVIQDGTGSRTLALPSNSRVNGSATTVTLLTAAAAENILSWYSPDGTAIRWTNGTY